LQGRGTLMGATENFISTKRNSYRRL